MDAGKLAYVAARGGRPHLRSLLARIDRLTAAGTWDSVRVIDRARAAARAPRHHRRHLGFLRRRGGDAARDAARGAARTRRRDAAAHRRPRSAPCPFGDHVELEDAESGERRLVDARGVAPAYRAAVDAFLERCRVNAQRDGVDYALMTTDTPPEVALRQYLLRRSHAQPAHGAPRAVRASSDLAESVGAGSAWRRRAAGAHPSPRARPCARASLSDAALHRGVATAAHASHAAERSRCCSRCAAAVLVVAVDGARATTAPHAAPIERSERRARARRDRRHERERSTRRSTARMVRRTWLATRAIATISSTGDPASRASAARSRGSRRNPCAARSPSSHAFDSARSTRLDVATIPSRFGVRLVRVPSNASGPLEIRAQVQRAGDRRARHAIGGSHRRRVEAIAPSRRRRHADDSRRRGRAARVPTPHARRPRPFPFAMPLDSASHDRVVTPGYEGRADLLARHDQAEARVDDGRRRAPRRRFDAHCSRATSAASVAATG